jgi:nitroreductase
MTDISAADVDLYEGLLTTRAIRRYRPDPVPEEALRDILFAATRAPSGSNRQPFRFIVLSDGAQAQEAKALIAEGARRIWSVKSGNDGYGRGSGAHRDSPKSRMAATMSRYVEDFGRVPVLVLACLVRYREPTPTEGGSVYPACQNLLLAARAKGYGGVMTNFHLPVEPQLRELLGIPDGTLLAATITLGRPEGSHGPVRRRPLAELVFTERWGQVPRWAIDPQGTRHTSAGPPAAGGVRSPD